MKPFYILSNTIRDYPWGDHKLIPEFTGREWPTDRPAAELWMGAHPLAPSVINGEAGPMGLDEWISENAEAALGESTASEYGRLPFLLKLLAAARPLSIQAHPDKLTAEAGYAREEEQGIAGDAANRNYKDDNHKPEIIMALTPFTAMMGFRSPEQIYAVFSPIREAAQELDDSVWNSLRDGTRDALQSFFGRLLTLNNPLGIISAAQDYARVSDGCWDDSMRHWVARLIEEYPRDVGVLAPLFLNLVHLSPGQALFQGAGALHAYLEGFGVELMANSDNVLRGGLTGKHIDVPELLAVLRFEAFKPDVLTAVPDPATGIAHYPIPVGEFSLGIADLDASGEVRIEPKQGPRIVLILDGRVTFKAGDELCVLTKGQSLFVPGTAPPLTLSGAGRAALAGVGS